MIRRDALKEKHCQTSIAFLHNQSTVIIDLCQKPDRRLFLFKEKNRSNNRVCFPLSLPSLELKSDSMSRFILFQCSPNKDK